MLNEPVFFQLILFFSITTIILITIAVTVIILLINKTRVLMNEIISLSDLVHSLGKHLHQVSIRSENLKSEIQNINMHFGFFKKNLESTEEKFEMILDHFENNLSKEIEVITIASNKLVEGYCSTLKDKYQTDNEASLISKEVKLN